MTENATQNDCSNKKFKFTHILLMGPSASGKTYVSQNQILGEILSYNDKIN